MKPEPPAKAAFVLSFQHKIRLGEQLPLKEHVMTGNSHRKATSSLASDFSGIAARYDSTRDLPQKHLLACYARLVERGLLPAKGVILDAGCGTGQLSLPLAALGYEVRGIDIAAEMTAIARAKVQLGWLADYAVGDVRDIALDTHSIDAVVVSKLFQHIEDWKGACRELIRVARPGACIIQINERGAFGNAVRRYFARRADELGYKGRYLGMNPHEEAELRTLMEVEGCETIPFDASGLLWTTNISYGEALRRLQDRLYAEFWYLPEAVHRQLVVETVAWIEARPEGHGTIERLSPYLVVEVFRTPGQSNPTR